MLLFPDLGIRGVQRYSDYGVYSLRCGCNVTQFDDGTSCTFILARCLKWHPFAWNGMHGRPGLKAKELRRPEREL